MENRRLSYKQDDHGNAIFARVCWSKDSGDAPKPIALIYHGGGLLVGSADIIPSSQINWLVNNNFLVVIPNYRLAPQVSAKVSFADAEEAYDWAITSLPGVLSSAHNFEINTDSIVAMGHSSGGTLAMHIASMKGPSGIKAVTAFYPSLFLSDTSTSAHKPTDAPPFGSAPDFEPTEADWKEIRPEGEQVSEFPLAGPGIVPQARNKWQMHILKHGEWIRHVLPTTNGEDGDEQEQREKDLAAIDPLTRISGAWPAVMIVQGSEDHVPGSSLELARRAEKELKDGGVEEVKLRVVEGESHMFDLPPMIGTSDLGPKWEAVVEGLEWLKIHA